MELAESFGPDHRTTMGWGKLGGRLQYAVEVTLVLGKQTGSTGLENQVVEKEIVKGIYLGFPTFS